MGEQVIFVTDFPDSLSALKTSDSLLRHGKTVEFAQLKVAGIADTGMIAKLDSAVAGIQAVVAEISFVDECGDMSCAVLMEILASGIGRR